MNNAFEDPHKKIQEKTDKILEQRNTEKNMGSGTPSIELQKVHDNLGYIKKCSDTPIKPGEYQQKAFGFKMVDMNNVEKNNIWDRGILTTDKICNMFLGWTIDEMLKYQKKKRKMDSKMLFLLLLLGGGSLIVVVMILLFMG